MAGLIPHPYERLGGPAPWRDQIWLTAEEWASVPPGWEEAEQDRRFNAWLADLTNPPVGEPNVPPAIGED